MGNVADYIIESLEKAGVSRIYGIVGDSLNAFSSALQKRKSIEWVHTRHEEVAAFAAGAEAQLTEKLSVCAGSCGPGNMHLINGLYDCHRSHAPVLAIAADIPSSEIGSGYFQETNPKALFADCTVFCERLVSVSQLPHLLHNAMQAAIGEKGVAVLIISGDMAMTKMPNTKAEPFLWPLHRQLTPDIHGLQTIAEKLNASPKVAIFAGHGARHANRELVSLAHKLQAPIIHTLRGKPYVEPNNPFDVGMTGLIGFSSGYHAMETCDTLLLLGTSFPYRQFYPEKAHIIQIDHRGGQLGKRCRVDYSVVGDVRDSIDALLPLVQQRQDVLFLQKCTSHYQKSRKDLDLLATFDKSNIIHPQYLTHLIDRYADEDALFTCDVGTPTVWAARYLSMNGKRNLFGSFNHGSMANAMAQAIGLQKAAPNRQVIALCGDGGFSMLMGDILTLHQYQLPIKLIVFNNSTLGFVEMEMRVSGMLEYGTSLTNPNFAEVAKAVGIKSIHVDEANQLESAIQHALSTEGPFLVDVKVNRNELVMPPTVTAEEVKGFGLFMLRAIINGKGTEVVDIIKQNLMR
ncbi:ubiquinone-dependent pyruvate dehydrogenase [Legionella sp. W05-934-2]|jgi:pyruvate dehydrogenase (quinone)|uniref:ubiquinone-dependent pyruvate dehydrogenase n=1 Tax=Legionella sp. W05-934-2 TaxID=1198649 RepID=UPI00346381DE